MELFPAGKSAITGRQYNLICHLTGANLPGSFPSFHFVLWHKPRCHCFHAVNFTEKSFLKFLSKRCLKMHNSEFTHVPTSRCYYICRPLRVITYLFMNTLLFWSNLVKDGSRIVPAIETSEANWTLPMTLAFISVRFRTAPSETVESWNKNKIKNQHSFWVRKE